MQSPWQTVFAEVRDLFERSSHKKLLFHSWHHTEFVLRKALEFSAIIDAESEVVGLAALTHDLNYLVDVNSLSSAGDDLRKQIFLRHGISDALLDRVNEVVHAADIVNRRSGISLEAKALSDADTLFKMLPITPILFSHELLVEADINIFELAHRIVSVQAKLVENEEIFLIEDVRKRYGRWARTNLELWIQVLECENDAAVETLLVGS